MRLLVKDVSTCASGTHSLATAALKIYNVKYRLRTSVAVVYIAG